MDGLFIQCVHWLNCYYPSTGLIIESKSPIVNMFFLNEWGDRQVVPYKPNQSVSGVAERTHQPIQRRPSQSPLTCPSTHHYAIFVDETKIRVCKWVWHDVVS